MKNILKFGFAFLLLSIVVSCETDEKFSGSPIGHQNLVTLKGSITTDTESALSGQKFKYMVNLPDGRTFSDTVRVEVSAINKSNGRIREYVIIEPGQTSAEGEIESPGGNLFNSTFELSLSGIELYTVEPGTHYLMTSDPLIIATGNSTVPTTNTTRLQVRLIWENATAANNVRFFVDKPSGTDREAPLGVGKNHAIMKESASCAGANGTIALSYCPGDYIFSITGSSQPTPVDLPYRVIVKFPNGDTRVFEGTYVGMSNASPLKPVLKVTKTGDGDDAVFSVTDEGL